MIHKVRKLRFLDDKPVSQEDKLLSDVHFFVFL